MGGRETALLSGVLFCVLTPFFAHAQRGATDGASTHGKRAIRAVRSELPVIVDGNLEEPAWQQAIVSLGFTQRDPQEGQPSTERTEFRVLYTATTLYIGMICYDSNVSGILATERRRDNALENDDTVTVALDTFHDHRNAFLFRTNPLGTQYDAMITDEGKDINVNWDEKWEVASQVTPAGWMVEFAIPFKSLRVGETDDGQVWGLDLERIIRRKNELSYWNNFRRGFKLEALSQAGHLSGLEGFDTGLRLRVKPFLLGGFTHSSNRFKSNLRNASDVGMEVMKYRITPSLTADITVNTDFAQTAVDDQQVNLDRFSLFFPEKREFFQEGSGIFEFGLAKYEASTDLKLFHSRTIGLSEGRETIPVPISAGARLTGKWKGLTLGLLNVQTDPLDVDSKNVHIPASNYGVVRVKRNVLARSTVGVFLLNREKGGTRDFSRVYGLDSNFTFFQHFSVSGLWARSDSPGNGGNGGARLGTIKWDSDLLGASLDYVSIEPYFRDDLGYVRRKNIRRLSPFVEFRPRPRSKLIRQIKFQFRSDNLTNSNDWEMQSQLNHQQMEVVFQSGDSFIIAPHRGFEKVDKAFNLRERVVAVTTEGQVTRRQPIIAVPAGDYIWWWWYLGYTANPARKLSGNFVWKNSPGYYGGNLVEWRLDPKLKVTNNLSFDASYRRNKLTFGQTRFTDHVLNFRVNYSFNNQWLTTTTIQYNNVDSFAGINFRLNYIFRPGDDFFLVYNEGLRLGDVFHGQKDRSIQAKLTYSFDF